MEFMLSHLRLAYKLIGIGQAERVCSSDRTYKWHGKPIDEGERKICICVCSFVYEALCTNVIIPNRCYSSKSDAELM